MSQIEWIFPALDLIFKVKMVIFMSGKIPGFFGNSTVSAKSCFIVFWTFILSVMPFGVFMSFYDWLYDICIVFTRETWPRKILLVFMAICLVGSHVHEPRFTMICYYYLSAIKTLVTLSGLL